MSISVSLPLQHGYTALMFAIENGHVRIVRELVLANANINRVSVYYQESGNRNVKSEMATVFGHTSPESVQVLLLSRVEQLCHMAGHV